LDTVGSVLAITLTISLVILLVIIFLIIFLINNATKPPKCLRDTPWKIYGINTGYFKRIDKNSAKVKLELQMKDHSISYFKIVKVKINYTGTITVPNHKWGGSDTYECWQIVDDKILTDVVLHYNGYSWFYDDEKLIGFRTY